MPSECAQPVADCSEPRSRKRSIRRALMAKEWHEQRWRFALGTLVMSGILAGLLRAQVIPFAEATLLVYWIIGMVLAIFLAMGSVAAEKADRTWEFLLAQPISRADVLLAKWRITILQLVGIMLIATIAGGLAMWSRGFTGIQTLASELLNQAPGTYQQLAVDGLAQHASIWDRWRCFFFWLLDHPLAMLGATAAAAIITLSCWLTPLFFVLSRARNEFAAALAGILLTIVMHLWLVVSVGVWSSHREFLTVATKVAALAPSSVNPMLPLFLSLASDRQAWLPAALVLDVIVWIGLPVWIVARTGRKAPR